MCPHSPITMQTPRAYATPPLSPPSSCVDTPDGVSGAPPPGAARGTTSNFSAVTCKSAAEADTQVTVENGGSTVDFLHMLRMEAREKLIHMITKLTPKWTGGCDGDKALHATRVMLGPNIGLFSESGDPIVMSEVDGCTYTSQEVKIPTTIVGLRATILAAKRVPVASSVLEAMHAFLHRTLLHFGECPEPVAAGIERRDVSSLLSAADRHPLLSSWDLRAKWPRLGRIVRRLIWDWMADWLALSRKYTLLASLPPSLMTAMCDVTKSHLASVEAERVVADGEALAADVMRRVRKDVEPMLASLVGSSGLGVSEAGLG